MLRFIEDLLQGASVEWKKLGDIVTVKRGKRLVKKELVRSGNFAVFQNSMTPLGFYNESNVNADTTFIICAGSAGEIGYSHQPFWAADDVCYFTPNDILRSKYLYYVLLNQQNTIKSQVRRAIIPRLPRTVLEDFIIPLPPLHIQEKIVAVLDKFTALERELETKLGTELVLRQKQYEYYRNKLLTFGEEVESKRLGDIVTIKRGKRLIKKELETSGNFAVFQNSIKPLGFYSASNVNADTTFAICAGSAGEIGYSHHPFWAADDVCYFIPNDTLRSKFLYYILLNQQNTIKSQVRRAIIPRLPRTVLEDFIIPIPPLHVQEKIVSILDKFNTLTNSITEELPREIALRHQQYEYYRDQLLTFPKK